MFDYITRNKLRFPSSAGLLTAEQLWDLPMTSARGASLDYAYKALNQELKTFNEDSLVSSSSNSGRKKDVEILISAVKYVFDVKQEENKAQLEKTKKAEARQLLQEAINKAEMEQLTGGSLDELKKKLAELSD